MFMYKCLTKTLIRMLYKAYKSSLKYGLSFSTFPAADPCSLFISIPPKNAVSNMWPEFFFLELSEFFSNFTF